MILSLEDELFFLPELSGGQNQGTNIGDSELVSVYFEEENLLEDATIVMNDAGEELVEYFEHAVHEENLLYPSTNWKERRELFIHILERSSTQGSRTNAPRGKLPPNPKTNPNPNPNPNRGAIVLLLKNVFIIILYYFCIACISVNRTR